MEQYHTYIAGNTVRVAEVMPQEWQEQVRREREDERERRRQQARRQKAREQRRQRRYLMFLTVAVAITGLVCVTYIQLQSSITTRMNHIAALEKEIAQLRTDNDTTMKRIHTDTDLTSIKKKAVEELGMVYASRDQVAYYAVADVDYMTQYEEIP